MGENQPTAEFTKLMAKGLSINPYLPQEILQLRDGLWTRWLERRKLKRVAEMVSMPWKMHVVSKRGLKKYIDGKNILSVLGGQRKFDWEADGLFIRNSMIGLERKALEHWVRVRRSYNLPEPAAPVPTPPSASTRSMYSLLGGGFDFGRFGMSISEAMSFLRDPAGNSVDLETFTTK
eukprot:TRINITY_DN533_c1_g1_i1.p1 TRINITY_DN533_c1_g1~~TRINITY_DN533_c1_g1_i1.p1  ORF type:complete len:198 (+),score=33.80 TRINITY_DN533_c1_g1_i1:65-595(+)